MSYGCGNTTCKACYPFTYRCAACFAAYPTPVANGDPAPVCGACEYDGVDGNTSDPRIVELVHENSDQPDYDGYSAVAYLESLRPYVVTWTETSVYRVEVEADSPEDALRIFTEQYQDNGHQEDPVSTEWTDPTIKEKD